MSFAEAELSECIKISLCSNARGRCAINAARRCSAPIERD